MPSPHAILDGLAQIANGSIVLAILWHVALGAALAMLVAGWRPSQRIARLFLGLLPASAATVAWIYGNPFNGTLLGAGAAVLVVFALRGAARPFSRGARWSSIAGAALVAFGWTYPHFLDESRPWFAYLYAAPVGLVPCPTLSIVVGLTLLAGGMSNRWSWAVGALGSFYGVFGTFVLGVWIDLVLLAGSLTVVGLAWGHRPGERSRLQGGGSATVGAPGKPSHSRVPSPWR